MIIDTHCHVYKSEMDNASGIIKKSSKNNIHLILNGTDAESNIEVLDLCDKYDNVHGALGYFPTQADKITYEDIQLLDKQLENDNIVAVGEIGLDYYHGKENKDKQIELFEKMINLAEKHDLPVIVHSRKAMQDTLDILKKFNVVGSLHSYSGSGEMAHEFIKQGFFIGIGGSVTHTNNKKTRKMLKHIDIEHILLETDSPYLSPQEKIGESNTPLNLKYIIRKIAFELDTAPENVMNVTTANAKRLFNI